jgi:hypothetical protein
MINYIKERKNFKMIDYDGNPISITSVEDTNGKELTMKLYSDYSDGCDCVTSISLDVSRAEELIKILQEFTKGATNDQV